MALGLGSKKTDDKIASSNGSNGNSDEEKGFGQQGYYDGFQGNRNEHGLKFGGSTKMNRIDKPVTKSISGSIAYGRRTSVEARAMAAAAAEAQDSDADITIGKQMELEAGNAIQYRTCSWQKVWPRFLSYSCSDLTPVK